MLSRVLAAATAAVTFSILATSGSAATVASCATGTPDASERVSDGMGGHFGCEFATGLSNFDSGVYDDLFFGGGFEEIERDSNGTNSIGRLTGNGGTKSGSFEIAASLLNKYSAFVLVFKAASDNVAAPGVAVAYNLGQTLSGDYLTPIAKTTGNKCKTVSTFEDCAVDISHVQLLGKPGTMAHVPLPAAGWFLLAGLGGLGAMRRLRK